jgi:NADH-quinone oxidoreductase subunit G
VPGAAEGTLAALAAALGSPRASGVGSAGEEVRDAAEVLREAGDVVVIWGERTSHAERGRQAVEALLAVAGALGVEDRADSGLIEVPAGTNGRGLREVGCLPGLGPGLKDVDTEGMDIGQMARADLGALLLVHVDPSSDLRERSLWEGALERAGSVIAFAGFRSDALDRHAEVVFPADAYAEKEGTLTHPDGRLQRLRQAIGRPGEVRAGWWVLAELCERLDAGVIAFSAPDVTDDVAKAVPFYGGLTLDEIGGRGVRWQERGAASSLPVAAMSEEPLEDPAPPGEGLQLGVRPSLWTGPETEHSPSLRFLAGPARFELSPHDAERLGVAAGDELALLVNGDSVRAAASVRSAVTPGAVFLVGGKLPGGRLEVRKA